MVDTVLISLSLFFDRASRLVEHLWVSRVSIVHTNNSMSPAMLQNTISLGQELLLLFEFLVCSQLLFDGCKFLSLLGWSGEWWLAINISSLVKNTTGIFKLLNSISFRSWVISSLNFIDWGTLIQLTGSWHSWSFLKRWWTILQIDEMINFLLLSSKIHKTDGRFDRLRADHVVWEASMSSPMLHHGSLHGHVLVIERVRVVDWVTWRCNLIVFVLRIHLWLLFTVCSSQGSLVSCSDIGAEGLLSIAAAEEFVHVCSIVGVASKLQVGCVLEYAVSLGWHEWWTVLIEGRNCVPSLLTHLLHFIYCNWQN